MREGWQVRGIGSGFIYDKTNGYILTNSHVVEGGEERAGREWWVRFADKRELPAKLIGADPKTDVAVLQVKAEGLAAVTLGDSDKIEVADSVLAVGNPFGLLEQTVTAGIISAKARRGLGLSSYEDFLQTDAAINQGNSGGPLVNLEGHVIGINTAIYSRTGGYQGVGFAIPINQADKIARKLIQDGRVVRGWMGIEARELTQPQAKRLKLSEGTGLLVEKRFRNSPAAQGGVELGDVIVKLAGREIRSAEELRDLIAELEPGKKVPVQVVREARGGRLETLDLTVTLGEQPQE
jgi:serine protease Do